MRRRAWTLAAVGSVLAMGGLIAMLTCVGQAGFQLGESIAAAVMMFGLLLLLVAQWRLS